MKDVGRSVSAILLSIAVIGVMAISVLQIFGGIYFGYSFLYYVPALCAFVMFPLATIGSRGARIFAVYVALGLFVGSYFFRNWHDVELASRESVWLVMIPHGAQLVLCVGVFLFAHRRGT
jgi:hypothetical protein